MACNMQRFIKRWQRNNGIDDNTYRAFLESVTGKRSTTEMTPKERWRCVEKLKEMGVRLDPALRTKPRQDTRPARPDAQQNDEEQSRLARHLWLLLKRYGILRDASERALLAYVERITKVKRLEWCTYRQINRVIETLKKWVARVERDLILDAIQRGKLHLPQGFKTLDAVERALRNHTWDLHETLHAFAQARQAYLDTYKPPRERKAA